MIVVGGILTDRQTTRPLAEKLAEHLSVINYDRRGRGESGDTAPYTVEREIEDLVAPIGEAGGTAAVYGHSSQMLALAPTMANDYEVVGDVSRGGAIPEELVHASADAVAPVVGEFVA